MATEIIMPKLGLTMKAGTVVNWLKGEGDPVGEKEPVLEIETEKLSYSIESPASGVLLKILATAGEKYPIKTVLGYVGKSGEAVPDAQGPIASANAADADIDPLPLPQSQIPQGMLPVSPLTQARIFISPVAKKIAAEMGIDYRLIKGTGPNGRIVKADVLNYSQTPPSARLLPSMGLGEAVSLDPEYAEAPFPAQPVIQSLPGTVIPYRGIRRSIGETMSKAWATIPMVTHHVTAGAGAIVDFRAMINAGITDQNDRVTIGELIIKLTASALAMVPIINSSLTDEGIVLHGSINIGMATAIGEGLIVPVICEADKKGLLAVSREAKYLASRAKSGGLSPDDVYGATFTVSNLGGFDSVAHFSPIITPPQAAVLGVGRLTEAVVPINGEIRISPVIGLSITYDHRIIDGATAAIFIKTLMTLMENPARAVLA